jgi:hypothetical protein
MAVTPPTQLPGPTLRQVGIPTAFALGGSRGGRGGRGERQGRPQQERQQQLPSRAERAEHAEGGSLLVPDDARALLRVLRASA